MQLIRGANYFLKGIRLISKPKIRRFVLIPLAVNISLFSLVIAVGYSYTTDLIDWLGQKLDTWITQLPSWLAWLGAVVDGLQWIIWPIFILTALLFFFFFFSLIANLIAAPFNGFLAEAVEQHLSGKAPQTNINITQEIITAISNELRKIVYFLLRALPLLILFLIPVINIAAPALWLIFSAWMLAVEYLDYPMSNHRITFKQQRQLHRQKRGLSFGFGGIVALANSIPLVNFIAMPSAVAGATALYCENFEREAEKYLAK